MGSKVEKARLYRNTVSYFGGLIVAIAILITLFLFSVNLSIGKTNPYVGILTYMVGPGIITCGHPHIPVRDPLGKPEKTQGRLERGVALPEARPQRRAPAKGIHPCPGRRQPARHLPRLPGYNAYLFTDSTTFCGSCATG